MSLESDLTKIFFSEDDQDQDCSYIDLVLNATTQKDLDAVHLVVSKENLIHKFWLENSRISEHKIAKIIQEIKSKDSFL